MNRATWLYILAGACSIGALALDFLIPAAMAVAMLHVLPVLIAMQAKSRRAVLGFGIAGCVMVLAGLLSPGALSATGVVNHLLAMFAVVGAISIASHHRKLVAQREHEASRFRRFFEASHDANLIVDFATGKIVDACPEARQLLGYDRAALRARTFSDVVAGDPGDSQAFEREAAAVGDIRAVELTLFSSDGSEIPVLASAMAIDDADSKRMMVMLRDLVAVKAAETRAERFQTRLDTLTGVALRANAGVMPEDLIREAVDRVQSVIKRFPVAYASVSDSGDMALACASPRNVVQPAMMDADWVPDVVSTLQKRKPVAVSDFEDEDIPECRAMIWTPVFSAGRLFGALGILADEPHAWTEQEVKTLAELAEILTMVASESHARTQWHLAEERLRSCKSLLEETNEALNRARQARVAIEPLVEISAEPQPEPESEPAPTPHAMTFRKPRGKLAVGASVMVVAMVAFSMLWFLSSFGASKVKKASADADLTSDADPVPVATDSQLSQPAEPVPVGNPLEPVGWAYKETVSRIQALIPSNLDVAKASLVLVSESNLLARLAKYGREAIGDKIKFREVTSATPASLPDADAPGFLRVLLAEDVVPNRRLLHFIVEKHGAELVTVANGREAVDESLESVASGAPYDLVLINLRLSEASGFDVVDLLRAGGYEGPIVAMASNPTPVDRAKCEQKGIDDLVSLPINRIYLDRVLAAHLARPEARSDDVRPFEITAHNESEE